VADFAEVRGTQSNDTVGSHYLLWILPENPGMFKCNRILLEDGIQALRDIYLLVLTTN